MEAQEPPGTSKARQKRQQRSSSKQKTTEKTDAIHRREASRGAEKAHAEPRGNHAKQGGEKPQTTQGTGPQRRRGEWDCKRRRSQATRTQKNTPRTACRAVETANHKREPACLKAARDKANVRRSSAWPSDNHTVPAANQFTVIT